MKTYSVVFSPGAEEQPVVLYRYIAFDASPVIAQRYVDANILFCESLQHFPRRGIRRDDIRRGLRMVGYKRRANIAFAVDAMRVSIIGVHYGGRDYEAALKESDLED